MIHQEHVGEHEGSCPDQDPPCRYEDVHPSDTACPSCQAMDKVFANPNLAPPPFKLRSDR